VVVARWPREFLRRAGEGREWDEHDDGSGTIYQPSPIPLLANQTVVDQPAGLATLAARVVGCWVAVPRALHPLQPNTLYTLATRYSTAATGFIESSAAAAEPFLLCPPPRHRRCRPGMIPE
jgi:hypothetical protein